jgi:hypothetical protein
VEVAAKKAKRGLADPTRLVPHDGNGRDGRQVIIETSKAAETNMRLIPNKKYSD